MRGRQSGSLNFGSRSDLDLVMLAQANAGDKAFAELVRRHHAGLRAFLRRFAPDAAEADDIAQETFLKAHLALPGFRGGSSFRSWLFAIAWREFLQFARGERSRARINDRAADFADDLSASQMAWEMAPDLRTAVQSLDAEIRAAVILCDAVGMSHAEAAAALGAPLGTIKSRILRGRERLRAILDDRCSQPEALASTQTEEAR